MTKKKHKKKQSYPWAFVLFWSTIRIVAVPLLWWNPIIGFFINFFLDVVDGDIFERLKAKHDWYENWDKILDWVFYAGIAVYVYTLFPIGLLRSLLLWMFAYRTVGEALFFVWKKEWLLFLFPNFFTCLFIISLLFPVFVAKQLTFALLIVLGIGLFKEWWIHLAHLDLTNMFAKHPKKWL